MKEPEHDADVIQRRIKNSARIQDRGPRTEDRYKVLFDSVDQGICVLQLFFDENDRPIDYSFLEVNPAFEKLTGMRNAQGKRVRELVPSLSEFWFEVYGRVAVTGESIRFERAEPAMSRVFDVYAFRIGAPENRQVALLFSDITEREKSAARLRESEEQLRFALSAGSMGTWTLDTTTGAVKLSEETSRVFGLVDEITYVGDTITNVIHPADQAHARWDLEQSLKNHTPYLSEYRIIRPADGELRWILATGKERPALNGQPAVFTGVVIDITARKKSEEASVESQRNFQLLFESAPGFYLVLNPKLEIVAASNSYTRATMTSRDEILGRHVFDVFPDNPQDPLANGVARLSASFDTVLKTKSAHTMALQKYDVRRPDGTFEEKWWSPVNSPVLRPDGKVAYIIHRAEDVTDFVRNRQKIANVDFPDLSDMTSHMNAELFQRAQEIQDVNFRLRQALEELGAAKDEAERANHLKSAFLANMSHEIRTPLGAMIGFADLLRDPELNGIQRANYIDVLTRNGESLAVIINDILDLSKVEAGHLTLEYTDIFPEQIAEDVVSLLRVKAKEKDLVFEYVRDESTPQKIVADPVRVRQILVNLIGNAIKFTQFGSVTVRSFGTRTGLGNQMVGFEIIDTGIGIPEEQRERIFKMFVQADGTTTRRFGGTGLGLALSKRLAESLGGDVSVTKTAAGKGSTFLVTIKDQPELKSAGTRLSRTERERRADFAGRALEGVKILVVDDAPDNRKLIWHYLNKQGALIDRPRTD